MSDESFYLRIRGKISGPFDVATLQKLVRRGTLSRIHEISGDRANWSAAGDFEDLFPLSAPTLPPVQEPAPETRSEVNESPVAIAESESPSASASTLFCYTQRGSTVGPVPLAVLKALAENGTLRHGDLVWRENAETGATADQFPALAPFFTERRYQSPQPRSGDSRHLGEASSAALASAGNMSRITGLGAGIGLLVVLNLPWFTIDKKLVWWWDAYQAPDTSLAIFVTTMVFAATALCILAPLASGVARGISYLSIMAAIGILFSITVLNSGGTITGMSPLLVSAALAILVGVCAFRSTSPDAVAGKVLLGICSGIATLGMLVAILNTLQDSSTFKGVPGGVAFGVMVCFVGLLAGLTTGILGFIGLKPAFTPALNTATGLTASFSLVLPGLGLFIVVAAAWGFVSRKLNAGEDWASPLNKEIGSVVAEICARILLSMYACLAVVAVGIRELLTASCIPREDS